jgi:hypothetical protein
MSISEQLVTRGEFCLPLGFVNHCDDHLAHMSAGKPN